MDAVLRFALRFTALAAVGCTPMPIELTHKDKPDVLRAAREAVDDGTYVVRQQAPAEPVVPAAAVADAAKATTQVRVVALIGSDVVVTDDEVWQMVRQRAPEYLRLTGAERGTKEKDLFNEELRKLIDRELILADFLGKIKKNKPQVAEELKDEAARQAARTMREFKKANKFTNDAEFYQALQQMGLSLKVLQRHLERNAIMSIYLQQYMKDKGKTASLVEIRRYYDENPDDFKVEDRVKWLDLFVSYRQFETTVAARQYAEQLQKQAAGGADFVGLVKKSGHGDSKLRDGEGIGSKPGEISPRELEPAVLQLTAGQVSGLVATDTGFHILKVLERDVAGVRPFDEKTQTAIRNKLTSLVHKAEYEKLIEDLWRKTTVKIVEAP